MLTENQKKIAEENHNLIFSFMRDHNILDKDHYYYVFAESLCKAAGDYDPSRGKFSTLAYKYMESDFKQELKYNAASKRNWDGEYVYLDAAAFDNDTNENREFIGNDNGFEDEVIEAVDMAEKLKPYKSKLSEKEKIVFSSRLKGMSYKEIHKRYGIPRTKAIGIFRRSRIKMMKYPIN